MVEAARPFKPYGAPPPLDLDEYKDSFELWHKQWEIFLSLSTIGAAGRGASGLQDQHAAAVLE